jgi:hypothetical protein
VTPVVARVIAGLAFAAVVLGTVTLDDGVLHPIINELVPATALLSTALPWLLAAALLATACSDHEWAPGAALGLTAGTAGLMAGAIGPLQVVGPVLAVLAFVRPSRRISIVAVAVGAGAMAVLLVKALPILGQEVDLAWAVVFWTAVLLLVGLAAHQLRAHPSDAIAPALLLVNAAWAMEPSFYPYNLAFLPLLVVVPLVEILVVGSAKLAARLVIAGVVLVRAGEYSYASSLDFTRTAHVLLTLAAVGAAVYFSRSR